MSGQIASLYADIRANVDDAVNNVNKFVSSMKGAAKETNKQGAANQTLNQSLGLLASKVITVAAAYKAYNWMRDSIKDTIKYADEVRNVARITGATTEESSRLIQVAEQVGVTTNTLTSAMQLAIKKGYEPTIDGLMRMSDEYKSILDPMERVLYLQERFSQGGRGGGGAGMAPLLELGSGRIQQYANDVNRGLVLSRQQVYQAQLTAFTLNQLGEVTSGAGTLIGSTLGNMIYNMFTSGEDKVKDLMNYAAELKKAGVAGEEFDQQMTSMANSFDLNILKTGELTTRGNAFNMLSRVLAKDFLNVAKSVDSNSVSLDYMTEAEREAYTEREKTKAGIRATVSSMLLSNAITDDGVSINEDYTRTMADIAAREAELNDILNDPAMKNKTNDIKAAREELEQLKQTEIEITAKYRQQTSVGLFNLFAGGMEGATDKDLLDIAHNMGILDDKTYGLQAAAFDLQDGLDGSADGLITMNDIARKNIGSFGDLNKVFTDLSENAPQGGSADYYYNLFITTYYRTVGSSGGGITAQVQTGGLGHQTRELKNQARHGGSFVGMAHGGIVPPGFSNDGMPVFVSSGERLDVTPAGNKDVTNTALLSKLDDLNYKLDGLPRAMKEAVLQVV